MIVLTNNGQFIRAKTKSDVDIGEEVSYSPMPIFRFSSFFERKMYSIPLAFVLALLLVFPTSSLFQTSTVYGIVSMDMNPSIELAVNDHYEIVTMIGYNEKGKSLLNSLEDSLEGMSLLNAASELLKEGHNQGMINDINTIYLSSALSFNEHVNFESWSISISDEYNFDVYSIFVEEGVVKEAQKLSISPAKLLLQSNSKLDNFDSKELSNTPMQEIEETLGESFDEIMNVENESIHWLPGKEIASEIQALDDNQKDNSLNPAGKQSHPNKQDHPGKGKGSTNEKKQSSEPPPNSTDRKPSSNESHDSSSPNVKVKGKPDHAGGGKSSSKQNGPPN
jgi:hypothetical protein